jgi:hypothetical protein
MRPLVAPLFLLRGAASLPVGVAVLRLALIVSAGETIVIATIVFGRSGKGGPGGDRQSEVSCSDGDHAFQGLLLLIFARRG